MIGTVTRVVISERFGGFGLSPEGVARLRELGWDGQRDHEATYLPRDDARLLSVVEEMGDRASSGFAALRIVSIPDGIEWHIHEYDGYESVHEAHRTWSSDGEGDC